MDHILFIYSSIDGHLGCFHLLAIVNNTAVHTDIQISIQILAFKSLGYTCRSGIADIPVFNFLRNHNNNYFKT